MRLENASISVFVQTAQGLVHEQDARLGRQGGRQHHAFARQKIKPRGRIGRLAAKPGQFENGVDRGGTAGLRPPEDQAGFDILAYCHGREDLRHLEHARHAAMTERMGPARQLSTVEFDHAPIRPDMPRADSDERALARSVGAGNAENLVRGDVKADIGQRLHRTEADRQRPDHQALPRGVPPGLGHRFRVDRFAGRHCLAQSGSWNSATFLLPTITATISLPCAWISCEGSVSSETGTK